jgi:hypothetical protein
MSFQVSLARVIAYAWVLVSPKGHVSANAENGQDNEKLLRRSMSILRKFKVTPSVMDPSGIYASAIVLLLEEPPTSQKLPELPYDVLRAILLSEGGHDGR